MYTAFFFKTVLDGSLIKAIKNDASKYVEGILIKYDINVQLSRRDRIFSSTTYFSLGDFSRVKPGQRRHVPNRKKFFSGTGYSVTVLPGYSYSLESLPPPHPFISATTVVRSSLPVSRGSAYYYMMLYENTNRFSTEINSFTECL